MMPDRLWLKLRDNAGRQSFTCVGYIIARNICNVQRDVGGTEIILRIKLHLRMTFQLWNRAPMTCCYWYKSLKMIKFYQKLLLNVMRRIICCIIICIFSYLFVLLQVQREISKADVYTVVTNKYRCSYQWSGCHRIFGVAKKFIKIARHCTWPSPQKGSITSSYFSSRVWTTTGSGATLQTICGCNRISWSRVTEVSELMFCYAHSISNRLARGFFT